MLQHVVLSTLNEHIKIFTSKMCTKNQIKQIYPREIEWKPSILEIPFIYYMYVYIIGVLYAIFYVTDVLLVYALTNRPVCTGGKTVSSCVE